MAIIEKNNGLYTIILHFDVNPESQQEQLVEFDFENFDGMYCHTSKFADDPWAREGCSE